MASGEPSLPHANVSLRHRSIASLSKSLERLKHGMVQGASSASSEVEADQGAQQSFMFRRLSKASRGLMTFRKIRKKKRLQDFESVRVRIKATSDYQLKSELEGRHIEDIRLMQRGFCLGPTVSVSKIFLS